MSYLQEALDQIEAEAVHKSRLACEGEAAINYAFALRDRLIAEEQFSPIIKMHYHGGQLEITVHAPTGQDDMLRVALAGLDFDVSDAAALQKVAPGVSVMFATAAQWKPMRMVA